MTIQQEIELSQLETIEEMIEFDKKYKEYLKNKQLDRIDFKNRINLNNGKTAVIAKYYADFNKWCENNPKYPNPVMISSLDDVIGKYFFVKSANHAKLIPNYRLIIAKCNNNINLKVAIISNFKIDAIRYNKTHPKYKAVDIYDMKTAQSYYYAEVICKKSANLLGGKIYVEKLVAECNTRLVYI